jgi:hypothetical protein
MPFGEGVIGNSGALVRAFVDGTQAESRSRIEVRNARRARDEPRPPPAPIASTGKRLPAPRDRLLGSRGPGRTTLFFHPERTDGQRVSCALGKLDGSIAASIPPRRRIERGDRPALKRAARRGARGDRRGEGAGADRWIAGARFARLRCDEVGMPFVGGATHGARGGLLFRAEPEPYGRLPIDHPVHLFTVDALEGRTGAGICRIAKMARIWASQRVAMPDIGDLPLLAIPDIHRLDAACTKCCQHDPQGESPPDHEPEATRPAREVSIKKEVFARSRVSARGAVSPTSDSM